MVLMRMRRIHESAWTGNMPGLSASSVVANGTAEAAVAPVGRATEGAGAVPAADAEEKANQQVIGEHRFLHRQARGRRHREGSRGLR